MERTTDITRGEPAGIILRFALPLILTNIGQQLYSIADAAIVGRGVGMAALAAVISVSMMVFGRQVVRIFLSASERNAVQALDIAYQYLFIMSLFLMACWYRHMQAVEQAETGCGHSDKKKKM